MKVLVTGALGLLGREVCREARLRGWAVVGVDLAEGDLAEPGVARGLVASAGPEAIVHCAAWTEVDACEADPERALRINAVGARNVAVAARRANARMVHVSTDYVFSGDREGPYREGDPVGPLSVYGASKEASERWVREQTPEHFILRTAWLYGETERCFPAAIERLGAGCALKGRALRVVDDQHGTPTWSRELARQIARLLPTEAFGTYHATAAGETTWYRFACRILRDRGVETEVVPCTTEEFPRPAHRPRNSVLDNFGLRAQGLDVMKPWEEAWEEFLASRESGEGPEGGGS
jgi:dTDP-4-dehydrorhamnose reductase